MPFTSFFSPRKPAWTVGLAASVATVTVVALTLRNDNKFDSDTSVTSSQEVSTTNGLLDIEALTAEEIARFRPSRIDGSVSGQDAGEATPAEQFYRHLSESYIGIDEAGKRFEEILQTLSGSERGEFLSAIGRLLAPNHGGLLHKALLPRLNDHRERHLVAQTVISELLPDRALDAASWIAGLESGFTRQHAHESIGRQWAKEDLHGALAWIDGLAPESDDKTRALEGVVWTWMQDDPAAVDTYIMQVQEPDLQRRLTSKAVKILAAEDPRHAIAWALDRADAGDLRELLDYTVSRWATQDYEAARHWVEQLDPAEESIQHGAANALVRVWSREDPAGASAWMLENHTAFENQGVLLQATRNWAAQDPDGASAWLVGVDDRDTRHLVLDNITRTLATKDHTAAEEWINGIDDVDLRARGQRILEHKRTVGTRLDQG